MPVPVIAAHSDHESARLVLIGRELPFIPSLKRSYDWQVIEGHRFASVWETRIVILHRGVIELTPGPLPVAGQFEVPVSTPCGCSLSRQSNE